MKRSGWRLVALLVACHQGVHESDVVVHEVQAPLHVRVVSREHDEPVDCSGATGVIDRVSCIFRTNVTTCTWLEVDGPQLNARPFGADLRACQLLPQSSGPRIVVHDVPVSALQADPDGERVLYRGAGAAYAVYVLDGVVIGVASLSPTAGLADLPPLADRLPEFFAASDDDAARRILAYAEKKGGMAAVVDLMAPVAESSIDRWHTLYESLDDDALRVKARRALHELLDSDEAGYDLISGLIAYPDVQPANFRDLMARTAKQQVSMHDDWYSVEPLLEELERRKDPLAGELACRIYGMQVISAMPGVNDDYVYGENIDGEGQVGALELLARTHTRCPWIAIALDQDPCASVLRCELDGGLPDPNGEDLPYDEESGEPLYVPKPLCGRQSAQAALKLLSRPPPAADSEYEAEDLATLPGPLLMGLGYEQGVVSKALIARNERRMYRYVWPKPATDEEGDPVDSPPCQRPRNLPDAVCRLPLELSEVVFNDCRARIDDKAHVVRVEVSEPK